MGYFVIANLRSTIFCLSLLSLIGWVGQPLAENLSNVPAELASPSGDLHNLHLVILWICGATAVAVFAAMIYSIVVHRKSQGGAMGNFHKKSSTEFIWTVIPFAIVVLMAIPAAKTSLYSVREPVSEIQIRITGEDCTWRYDYLNHDISFPSSKDATIGDGPVVLPIQKAIHLTFISNDRAYLWSVGDLDLKQRVTPNGINTQSIEIRTAGVYRGDPVDGCGPEPFVVVAATELEFEKWISSQRAADAVIDQRERR